MGLVVREKLIFIVLVASVTAIGLLVVRQRRIETVSQMTRALEHARAADLALWDIRAALALDVTPENVRSMSDGLGPLAPLPLSPRAEMGLRDVLCGAGGK